MDALKMRAPEEAERSKSVPQARSSFITADDGTQIFYKEWGEGIPVVFSHGWPLNADIWDDQLMFFAMNGFRAVAHDRRGHGRSQQPSDGNDMDTYADDLASVMDALDLRGAMLVGHSTGGGEITRYIGRHGTSRVAKVVLVSAIPPVMLWSPENPNGTPMETFDAIRAGVRGDRSQFYKDLAVPFFGANRPGVEISQGMRDYFWMLSMQAGLMGAYECINEFSESSFHDDLRKFDVPALIVHGDDDQIVPVAASALLTAKIVPNAELKIYPGAGHALPIVNRSQFNADLLAFARS
jgi:non-heme chloroperoxidase